MENIVNYYKGKEVFIVGALDSLGVPYTADNFEMKSYIELTADELTNNNIDLTCINISSLGRNKTWQLQSILDRDYSIGQYNKLNQQASDYVISGGRKDEAWLFPTNPNFINEYYKNTPDSSIHITSKLKEVEAPIFLYSCGGMNIRDYFKVKSEMTKKDALLFAKEVLLRTSKHINQTKEDISDVLKQISDLNPNMEIYALGIYAMLDDPRMREILWPMFNIYNHELKQVISQYPNVHYVDITKTRHMVAPKDMHPTLEGQKYMSKQLIKTMDEVCMNKIKH